jgi:hypothetical protein
VRVLAMWCVLLVAAVGTVQAVHIHGEWLPKNAAQVAIPTDASQGQGEEHCPLCVAMHSALPTTMQVVPAPVQQVTQALYTHVLVAPEKLWSFAMFSRPPPVGARTLAASHATVDSNVALLAVMTAG